MSRLPQFGLRLLAVRRTPVPVTVCAPVAELPAEEIAADTPGGWGAPLLPDELIGDFYPYAFVPPSRLGTPQAQDLIWLDNC